MLWAATILSQLFLGFFVCRNTIPMDVDYITLAGVSIPIGVGLSCAIYFGMGMILGQNFFHLLINGGVCISLPVVFLFKNSKSKKHRKIPKITDFIYPFFCLLGSYCLFYTTQGKIQEKIPGEVSKYLQEDLALLSSFEHGINSGLINPFSIKHPDYYKGKAKQRWIPSFYSSMLRDGLAPLGLSMAVPSCLFFTSYCIICRALCLKMGANSIASMLAPFITFTLGGYSFFSIAENRYSNEKYLDFVYRVPKSTISTLHPILHVLIGFRSSLFTAVYLTLCLYSLYLKDAKILQIIIFALSGFIIPATIGSSFLLFAITFSVIFLFNLEFPLHIIASFSAGAAIHIHRFVFPLVAKPIYDLPDYYGKTFSEIRFFIDTTGIFLLILFIMPMVLRGKEFRIWLGMILSLFIIIYKTSEIESRMTMLTFYSFVMPIASVLYVTSATKLSRLYNEEASGFLSGIATILILANCISSVYGTYRQYHNKERPFGIDQLRLRDWILKNSKSKDVFIGDFTDLDTVTTLCGRRVFFSNDGVSNMYGFNATQRKQEFLTHTQNLTAYPFIKFVIIPKQQAQFQNIDPSFLEVFGTSEVHVFKRKE